MYRFLLTRNWVGGLALAVALAVACVLLGSWQWSRYEQRSARNDLVVANYDRDPEGLDDVLPEVSDSLAVADTWTPVRVVGTYLESSTTLVRNRPLDGRAGYEVLVPLATQDGLVLVVNRGWLPTGQDGGVPDSVPRPPSGVVEVVARLLPPEEPDDRDAPPGQAFRIVPTDVAPDVATDEGALVTGAFGRLVSETGGSGVAGPVPAALPRPDLEEGPHLGYALQWVVFAVIALVGFGVLARRTAHEDDDLEDEQRGEDTAGTGPDQQVGPRRPPRAARTDEQVEDAEVDAAERTSGLHG